MTDIVERARSYEVGNLALQETWVREMHELAAEIERLRETIVDRELEIKDHLAEIERLRTDGQEGRQLAADNFERAKKAESEIERLRMELNACGLDCETYFNRSEELATEIERLRKWLEHIANYGDGQHAPDWAQDALNSAIWPEEVG